MNEEDAAVQDARPVRAVPYRRVLTGAFPFTAAAAAAAAFAAAAAAAVAVAAAHSHRLWVAVG